MGKHLFITGTGTDIGKTYVTGLIIKKIYQAFGSAAYYKVAMSGNLRDKNGELIPGDATHVKIISGIKQSLQAMCPYVYEAAVSPHLASKKEGNSVDFNKALKEFDKVREQYEFITVEGSGGIVCPLADNGQILKLEDFIMARDIPCLIVADAGLGTINALTLTAYYMKARGIRIKGIIFNRFQPENMLHCDNLMMCQRMTGLEVICCVKEGDEDLDIDVNLLASFYDA